MTVERDYEFGSGPIYDDEDDFTDDLLDDFGGTGEQPTTIEQQLRRRPGSTPSIGELDQSVDDLSFGDDLDLTSTPSRSADRFARSTEQQLRKKPAAGELAIPGVAVTPAIEDSLRKKPATSELAIPGTVVTFDGDEPTTSNAPKVVISEDIESNFDEIGRANAAIFDKLQDGYDDTDPEARQQYHQLRFFARLQTQAGGADKFYSANAVTKRAVIKSAVDAQLSDDFPGYGRGLKMSPDARRAITERKREIENAIIAGTRYDVQGIRSQVSQKALAIGETPDDTIRNIISHPLFPSRETLDNMTDRDASRTINNVIKDIAGNDRALERKLQLHATELITGQANLTNALDRVAPNEGAPKKVETKEGFKSWVWGGIVRTGEGAGYVGTEVAKFPGYISTAVGALGDAGEATSSGLSDAEAGAFGAIAPTDTEAQLRKPNIVSTTLRDIGQWWTTKADSLRDEYLSTDATVAKRKKLADEQGKAFKEKTLGSGIRKFFSAMAENPVEAAEQITGMVAGSFGGAAVAAKVAAKATAKTASKQTANAVKIGSVAGTQAGIASGQAYEQTFNAAFPKKGTPEFAVKFAEFSNGPISKAAAKEAKEQGWVYDAEQHMETIARRAAGSAATVAGLIAFGSSYLGGSFERLLTSTANNGSTAIGKIVAASGGTVPPGTMSREAVKQFGKSGLIEGMSEGLEEYATAVAGQYYDNVVKEFGDNRGPALYAALNDGRSILQASIGTIMGGAFGGGFGALRALGDVKTAKAAADEARNEAAADEARNEAAEEAAAPVEPAPAPDLAVDPTTAQALARQRGTAIPADDGVIYAGQTVSDRETIKAQAEAQAEAGKNLEEALRKAAGSRLALPAPDGSGIRTHVIDNQPITIPSEDKLNASAEAALSARRAQEEVARRVAVDERTDELSAEVDTIRDELAKTLRKKGKAANAPRVAELRASLQTALDAVNAHLSANPEAAAPLRVAATGERVDITDGGITEPVLADAGNLAQLAEAQKPRREAAAVVDNRATEITSNVADVSQKIDADKKALKRLAQTIYDEQATEAGSRTTLAKQALDRAQVAYDNAVRAETKASSGKTTEQLASRGHKAVLTKARLATTNARKVLETAQAAFNEAQQVSLDYENGIGKSAKLKEIKASEEYKNRAAAIEQAIQTQTSTGEFLLSEAEKNRASAQQLRGEFTEATGLDLDTDYTNRQAQLAKAPIALASVNSAITRFGERIRGVSRAPIDIRVLDDDAAVDAAQAEYGEFPTRTFSTFARTEKGKEDGRKVVRQVIYVNRSRIEEAEAGGFEQELASKAATQFVIMEMAKTDSRFRNLITNVARSAYRTREGRIIHDAVSAGFRAGDANPDLQAFNIAYIAELLRTAPRTEDANGNPTYNLTRSLPQRAAAAIARFMYSRWPDFSEAIGIRGVIADIETVTNLLSRAARTDSFGYLNRQIDGDWTDLFIEGKLDRQRRTFKNTERYTGGVGKIMNSLRDRDAIVLAIDGAIDRVTRGAAAADLPEGMGIDEAIARLESARNAVEMRVIRTDNRVRREAEPLLNNLEQAVRAAARSVGESTISFTKKFDQYVQLVSIREMVNPGGDFYLSRVKVSAEAKRQIHERLDKLNRDANEDPVARNDDALRAKLGRDARADIDAIVAMDRAGEPPTTVTYAGFDRISVQQAIDEIPASLRAAFEQAYPVLRQVIDRATEIKFESGEYDPLDIAFRGRGHFVYRGGQEIDASRIDEITDDKGRVIAGRKAIGSADETFSAKGRRDLPKNATVTATTELLHAISQSELSKVANELEFVAHIDKRLNAKGRQPDTNIDRSTPSYSGSLNFDFKYDFAAAQGSTKSVQYRRPDGSRGLITFAHEDVANGLRQHSVDGKWMNRFAQANGIFGSLYTTRNPAFVLGTQAPRDLVHNTLAIIAPRHGIKAAAAYQRAVFDLVGPVRKYTALDAAGRADFLAKLPENHPLRRYVAQGVWFGAHAQHSASDIAERFRDKTQAEQVLLSSKLVRHTLETLPEATDNLFRVAYFDIATRGSTKNRLSNEDAALRAQKLMDFSSGSKFQRSFAPFVPFARAWSNGAYNLMFHDVWQNGRVPTKEVMTADGRRAEIDWSAASKQFVGIGKLLTISAMGAAMYGLSRALADPDDDPPSSDDLTKGILLPGGFVTPYQYGVTKVFGSLGALGAAVANDELSIETAARTWANTWAKEATPLGLQYVPSTEQASWVKTMLSQATNANFIGKFVGPPALNTTSFGRTVYNERGGGKPNTPNAYQGVSEDYPDLAAYMINQFGYASAIVDYAFAMNSTNITDEEVDKRARKLVGMNSFVIGGYGKYEQEEEARREAGITEFSADLARAKRRERSGDKKSVPALRRSTPGAVSMEAYLKLDRRLAKEYATARRTWAGRPDFSARIRALEERQRQQRQRAMGRVQAARQ